MIKKTPTKTDAQILKEWKKATLDFIFYKVMRHHQEACRHLLEMLLEIKIESIEINTEETIALDFDSKGIRLDVFIKDTNRLFDVELQVANTKELPERARYYQGVMDGGYREARTRTTLCDYLQESRHWLFCLCLQRK